MYRVLCHYECYSVRILLTSQAFCLTSRSNSDLLAHLIFEFIFRFSETDALLSAAGHLQCKPMRLPALGTQRIIQGNGTNVGSVISLQCPAKHKLMGKELTCVLDSNSTHWAGWEPFCKRRWKDVVCEKGSL